MTFVVLSGFTEAGAALAGARFDAGEPCEATGGEEAEGFEVGSAVTPMLGGSAEGVAGTAEDGGDGATPVSLVPPAAARSVQRRAIPGAMTSAPARAPSVASATSSGPRPLPLCRLECGDVSMAAGPNDAYDDSLLGPDGPSEPAAGTPVAVSSDPSDVGPT